MITLKRYNIYLFILFSTNALAYEAWKFDSSQIDSEEVDVSIFEQGGQLPGKYDVDIYLNGEKVSSEVLNFQKERRNNRELLNTCIDEKKLILFGVEEKSVHLFFHSKDKDRQCADFELIPGASQEFQFYNQRLNLNIPQAFLKKQVRGLAPQEVWDDGIPAVLLNYRFSTFRTDLRSNRVGSSTTNYIQLEPGVNLGSWRIRNSLTWMERTHRPSSWQSSYLYAERGINKIKSRLTLGEKTTPSEIFDSIPFSGFMLGTDDMMIPYPLRSYKPTIRGVAVSQANVEIRQNGYVVYNTSVPPGEFLISDFSSSSSGGDLEVRVYESVGKTQIYTIPWTSPTISLSEGMMKYNIMVGKYRSVVNKNERDAISQVTLAYGTPWGVTGYGGIQLSKIYNSLLMGVGASLGSIGAISFDNTYASGRRYYDNGDFSGNSFRFRYNKYYEPTNTSFSVSRYQSLSSELMTFLDVLDRGNFSKSGTTQTYSNGHYKIKARSSINVSQPVFEFGYLNLTASKDEYWNKSLAVNNVMAGFSTTVRDVSLSLSYSRNNVFRKNRFVDNVISFSMSIPLGSFSGGEKKANYQLVNSSANGAKHTAGVNGKFFDNKMNLSVSEYLSTNRKLKGNDGGNIYFSWDDKYGSFSSGYSYTDVNQSMNAQFSGGALLHSEGVTFSQSLDNTVVLVSAPGAVNIPVGQGVGVRTDGRGYTTAGYVTPYQENMVSIDPLSLPDNVDLNISDVKVVPTSGAIVMAKFKTKNGIRALFKITNPDGSLIPFGASVRLGNKDGNNNVFGIVGDNGEVYLSGIPEKGVLTIGWGRGERNCHLSYDINLLKSKEAKGMPSFSGVCHP